MKTQPGLKPTWVEICPVFTRGRLESSAKNSIRRFSYHPYEKGSCVVHDEPFQPGPG